MKLLKLDICFRLPDDFDGDLNDALEEMVKYRRREKNQIKDDYIVDQSKSIYENWWDMVHSSNHVLLGQYSLHRLNEENEWVSLDNKTNT